MHYKTATEALMRLRGIYNRALLNVTLPQALEIVEAGIAAEQPLVAIALEYEEKILTDLREADLSELHLSNLRDRAAHLKALLDPIRPPPVPPSYEELTGALQRIQAMAVAGSKVYRATSEMLQRMPK